MPCLPIIELPKYLEEPSIHSETSQRPAIVLILYFHHKLQTYTSDIWVFPLGILYQSRQFRGKELCSHLEDNLALCRQSTHD